MTACFGQLSRPVPLALWAIVTVALHAVAQSSAPPATAQHGIAHPSPLTVIECEGINKCTPWTFYSRKGYAKWPTGEEAILEIVNWSESQIKIERTDTAGSRRGFTTVYTGTIDDKTMGGKYNCQACGDRDSQGAWYFVDPGSQYPLPQLAHFCDVAHCLTFRLEGGRLVNYTNLPYQQNEKRVLSFRSFSVGSVVFDRQDEGSYPLAAHYEGRITEDGLASGMTPSGRQWRMSWGARINEIASEDDPRGSPVLPTQGYGEVTPHDFVALVTAFLNYEATQ
jgi:hypothetical protein